MTHRRGYKLALASINSMRGAVQRWLNKLAMDPAAEAPPAPLPPPINETVTVSLPPMGLVEICWEPSNVASWVGLVLACDQHEGEKMPPAPELVGLELNGLSLLDDGGRVRGIPAVVIPGCRVKVAVRSVCPWELDLHVHFQFRPAPVP